MQQVADAYTRYIAMKVNYYYSIRVLEANGYTEADDSLLTLCRACAKKYEDDVKWAQRGDDECECEFCDATNDPERTAHLNVLFTTLTTI